MIIFLQKKMLMIVTVIFNTNLVYAQYYKHLFYDTIASDNNWF